MTPLVFKGADGTELLYRQGVYHDELPGAFSLLIFFHGAGERGNDNEAQLRWCVKEYAEYVETHGLKCVILAPQCPAEKKWVNVPWEELKHDIPEQPSPYIAAAMGLLDSKVAEFKVNTKRIYVSGISMGGYGTWDILARRPHFFAAAFPICGGADVKTAPLLKHLPVRFVHGECDSAVPVFRSRSMSEALRLAGNTLFRYEEIPDAEHNVWSAAVQDFSNLDWLFSQEGE